MILIQTWAEVAPISIQIEILNMGHVQEEVICVINKCLTTTIADSLHPNIPHLTCKIDDIMRLMTTIVVMMAVE
jgi:hypothetical protein